MVGKLRGVWTATLGVSIVAALMTAGVAQAAGAGLAASAETAPAAKRLDIPLVDGVTISVNEEAIVSNAVNLTIDFWQVPSKIRSKIDQVNVYITKGPVPVDRLLLEDFHFDRVQYFNYSIQLTKYAQQLQGITEPYITQVYFDEKDQPIGYYTQQTDLQPMAVTKSERFSEITEDVRIFKETTEAKVDVSEVFGQAGNQAFYYSVHAIGSNKGGSGKKAAVVDEILSGHESLYRQDDDPNLFMKYSLDSTYYVVFYDRNFQAVSYYAGTPVQSAQQALKSVITRITALPEISGLTLVEEEAVAGALRRFEALSEEQKRKVGQKAQNKLNTAVAVINKLHPLGSLGYAQVTNVAVQLKSKYLNLSSFKMDVKKLPGLLRDATVSFSSSLSFKPLDQKQMIKNQEESYKHDVNDPASINGSYPGAYLNLILYDKQGKITAYYSEPLKFIPPTAVWNDPIPQITDGIVIRKLGIYDGVEIDVSGYTKQNGQEAAYYTVSSQYRNQTIAEFKPEALLPYGNILELIIIKQKITPRPNDWKDQQYIIIFYNSEFRVLGYYQGKAA